MEILTEIRAPAGYSTNADRANIGRHKVINVDAQELAAELRKTIKGEVRFDARRRALYSTDASNYHRVPLGVVMPRSGGHSISPVAEEVSGLLPFELGKLFRRHPGPIPAQSLLGAR
jgi:hypothetical protein